VGVGGCGADAGQWYVLFSLEPHARMNPAKGEDDTKKWERS